MKLPSTASKLVDVAVAVGDIYIAAAVFGIAQQSQQQILAELMFAQRRNRLTLASWAHTPSAVLKALSHSSDVAVQLRLAHRNTPVRHIKDETNALTLHEHTLHEHTVHEQTVHVQNLVKQAKDQALSLSALKALSVNHNATVRANVVANQAFDASYLADFVTDKSAVVRRALASRLDISLALMWQLSGDTDSWVRQRLARNPSINLALMQQLASDDVDEVRRAVSRNTHCPIELLVQLAQDRCAWVRAGVAFQANTSSDLLSGLFKAANSETDIDVLSGVASHPNTPLAILLLLTQHQDADVRRGLILNPKVRRRVLLILLQDPYYLHRLLLVGHQQLSKTDQWSLHDDPDYRVRFSVFKCFADRFSIALINNQSH